MNYKNIDIEIVAETAHIYLNRPEIRNALNIELLDEMIKALGFLNNEQAIRFILLSGKGKMFCSGADLGWLRGTVSHSYAGNQAEGFKLARCFNTLYNTSKITICLVHGGSYGGSNGLVTACDFAYTLNDSVFTFSEVKLGLVAATIAPYVIRKIGHQRASELMLSGTVIDGKKAKNIGLVTESFENNEQLEKHIDIFLDELRTAAPEAQREMKLWLKNIANRTIDESLIQESVELITKSRISPESKEGIGAFFDKRQPNWRKEADA